MHLKLKRVELIISIFLISMVSANIVIQTQNMDIQNEVGNTSNYTLTITNNNSFDIFDFSFPELEAKGFKFNPYFMVKANSTNSTTFSVTTNESFFGTINAKVQFKYYVDLPEEIKTYPVLLTDYGFNPSYLAVRQGDTVQWTNQDDIIHDLYSLQFGTMSLSPNETKSFTFNSIGIFDYYDLDFKIFNEFNGQVQVINRTETQKVHNPNYDGLWIVNLNSYSKPTTISITSDQYSFEIAHTNSKNGLLTISNTGINTAEKISLTSNSSWLIFDENNFSIDVGDKNYVKYTILPFLLNTSESNKTYPIEVLAKGLNSNGESIVINLFVPYQEISNSMSNDIEVGLWYKTYYCPEHPCSMFCDPELPQCTQNQCLGNGSNNIITANMTSIELYNTISGISELKTRMERLENDQKLFQDKYGISIQDAVNLGNQSFALQQTTDKRQKGIINTLAWIGLFALLIVCVAFIMRRVNKRSETRSRTETGSMYSR